MRLLNKYKLFNKAEIPLKKFPLRLLKFHRPKWENITKNLVLNNKKSIFFQSNLYFKNSIKQWDNIKSYYKKGGNCKKYFLNLFDSTIKNSFFPKEIKKRQVFTNHCFAKLEYRIDILLWRLNFFASGSSARIMINNNLVQINGKNICKSFFVKKGDIITFKTVPIFVNPLLRYSLNENFFSFLEVDYYTGTVIIIKDLKELTQEDLNLFVSEYVNLNNLRTYI